MPLVVARIPAAVNAPLVVRLFNDTMPFTPCENKRPLVPIGPADTNCSAVTMSPYISLLYMVPIKPDPYRVNPPDPVIKVAYIPPNEYTAPLVVIDPVEATPLVVIIVP
jgi:hypothetical protein